MMTRPIRLQGTDGIRGPVGDDQPGKSPIRRFLENRTLTPSFVRLYTYAAVRFLINCHSLSPHQPVVLGYDPRDRNGVLVSAAENGIRAAGSRVIRVGCLPTPGVALYAIHRDCRAAFMITASHNPADQNGIKIFTGQSARKLLPEEEKELTTLVYEIAESAETADIPPATVQIENAVTDADRLFHTYHLDPANSWIQNQTRFASWILVVDAANGTLSSRAANCFTELGFGEVIPCNQNAQNGVNFRSGAGSLEGWNAITREMVTEVDGAFHDFPALRILFTLADQHRRELTAGRRILAAAFFDADGDRFYAGFYDPGNQTIRILNGDAIAFLQAAYMITHSIPKTDKPTFLYTVESDLNCGRTARKLGFRPVIRPVGDKWLLAAMQAGKIGIGFEETGHAITPGYCRTRTGEARTVLVGDALKSALNTFAAAALRWYEDEDTSSWLNAIHHPFVPGFRTSCSIWHVCQQRWYRKSECWQSFLHKIQHMVQDLEPACRFREIEFPEDPDMLYLRLDHTQFGSAALFVRNSGTEAKSVLYVRAEHPQPEYLEALVQPLLVELMTRLKDERHPVVRRQLNFLTRLQVEEPLPEDMLRVAASKNSLVEQRESIALQRCLAENLVLYRSDGCLISTQLGREWLRTMDA